MADVDIQVDTNDLKVALEQLAGYEQAFIKMVNTVQTETNRMNRAAKASSQEVQTAFDRMTAQITSSTVKASADWRKLERELTNGFAIIKRSSNDLFNKDLISGKLSGLSAKDSVFATMLKSEEEAAKQAAIALDVYQKEITSLTQKYAPLTAATQYYEKEVQNMQRAHALGLTSAKQMEVQLQNLKREYDALQQGTYLAGSRFNQFGQMADGAGKSANRVGMYAQQAGYQFGDMAVQIQSGTNVGVAFSQQMAQLAGLIPGVAGAVTTFAAIGIGLLIQNLTRSEKEAKKAAEAYRDVGSVLRDIEDIRSAMKVEDNLSASAKAAKKEYQEVLKLMEDVAFRKLTQQLEEPLNAIKKAVEEAKKLEWLQKAGQNPIDGSFYSERDVEFNSAEKQTKALQDQQNILFAINNIQGQNKEELIESYMFSVKYLESMGLMNPILQEQLANLGQQLGIKEQLNDAETKSTAAVQATTNYYHEQYRKIQDASTAARQELELKRVKNQYGEESVQYLTLEKEQLLQNAATEAYRNGLSQEYVTSLLSILKTQIEVEQSVRSTTTAAEALENMLSIISGIDISGVFTRAQSAASSLLGTINAVGASLARMGKLGLENSALEAEANALKNGSSPIEARRAGERVRYGNEISGLSPAEQAISRKAMEDRFKWEDEISAGGKAWNEANKPSRGGGGRGRKSDAEKAADKAKRDAEKLQEKFQEFIADHELYIEQQERLSGVFGKDREKLESVIAIEKQLGDARVLASQEQIAQWAEEKFAIDQKIEREKQMFDIGKNNFENFLMTVVDGTSSIGDAFKAMLSQMISDIYQTLVADPASDFVGGIVSGLLSANGNAFNSNGTKVTAFAKGGIVNTPTLFSYNGGNGNGLMGEAGPEAIMPLKRNSQGKLGVQVSGGSTGDVNISQHFHISANGDQAVKQIIQAQMPKIQEAAVQGVIAAKRRNVKGI